MSGAKTRAVRLRIGFWHQARQIAELARHRPAELRPDDWQARVERCGAWERAAIAELEAMQFVEAGELVLAADFRVRIGAEREAAPERFAPIGLTQAAACPEGSYA